MKCNHFWELDLTTIEDKIPTWICMNCGIKKKDHIPILDENFLNNFEKEVDRNKLQ